MLRLTDMTEYLEEMERIRRESESKTHFLTQVSHEIRTPLNTIRGMNEMILLESKDPQIRSYAEDIREVEETLLSLIGDILDVTRIEKANLVLEESDLSLAALFRKLWRATEVRCREKGLALIFTVDPLLPETVCIDGKRCYQIIENLLSNAVKYTEKGSVELLADRHGDNWMKIQVRDTGIGIPREDQEKIFHRFEQLDIGNRRHGLGLGLEITKNLVKLMGGRIEVMSEVGKGSCFIVILPVKFTSEKGVGTDWNQEKETCGRERLVYQCSGRKILVVDDNQMNRRVIRNYLKNTGIAMDEAASGKACLEKIASGSSYDLLLLDHRMPGMDGIELFHRIAALDSYKANPCPAIALTANAVKGARQMYLQEGFDDYLSKPVDAENLYLLLEEYLGGSLKRERILLENAPETRTAEIFTELEQQGMDLSAAKRYADDSEEFLLEELTLFAENFPQALQKLEQDWEDKNKKGMAVGAHSLKNNLATLGFTKLAQEAKNLELLLTDEKTDPEKLQAAKQAFLHKCSGLSKRLRELDE